MLLTLKLFVNPLPVSVVFCCGNNVPPKIVVPNVEPVPNVAGVCNAPKSISAG